MKKNSAALAVLTFVAFAQGGRVWTQGAASEADIARFDSLPDLGGRLADVQSRPGRMAVQSGGDDAQTKSGGLAGLARHREPSAMGAGLRGGRAG